MQMYVISLERTPDRLREFQRQNSHIKGYTVHKAVDGTRVGTEILARAGMDEMVAHYKPGAIGCALSHLELWNLIASGNDAATICEDDAILRVDFEEQVDQLIAACPADWDLVLWGWNLDSFSVIDLAPNLAQAMVQFSHPQIQKNQLLYQKSCSVKPRLSRLFHAFGTTCYSISPGGARKFAEGLFPMTNGQVLLSAVNEWAPNIGIDLAMSAFYPSTNSYVAMPPLATTPNDRSKTTIQAGSGT